MTSCYHLRMDIVQKLVLNKTKLLNVKFSLALLIHLLPLTTLVFPSLSKVYFFQMILYCRGCMYVHVCIYVHVCLHVCIYIYIYIYVSTYYMFLSYEMNNQFWFSKQNWNFLCPLQPVSFNSMQVKWSALLHHKRLLFFLICPCSSLLIWYFCETFQAVALLESVLTPNFFILFLRII